VGNEENLKTPIKGKRRRGGRDWFKPPEASASHHVGKRTRKISNHTKGRRSERIKS